MGCCLSRYEKPPPDTDDQRPSHRPSQFPSQRKSQSPSDRLTGDRSMPSFSEWRKRDAEVRSKGSAAQPAKKQLSLPSADDTLLTKNQPSADDSNKLTKKQPSLPSTDDTIPARKQPSLPSTDDTTPADTPPKRSKSPFPVSPPLKSESGSKPAATPPRAKNEARASSSERKSGTLEDDDRPSLIVPSPHAGKPLGFDNLGNTCYMNSVLQSLCRAPGFLEKLETRRGDIVVDRLARLFRSCRTQREVLSELRDFRRVLINRLPKFKGGQQEDAKDFLLELMSYLEKVNRPAAELFYGKRVDKITCLKCGNQIPAEAELFLVPVERQRASDVGSYLTQAEDDKFRLTGENKLNCGKCKSSSDATVQTKIVRAPAILVVYIEPFDMHGRRLKQNMSYSERVTLLGKRYDLFAVVVHRGSSIHSGHFIAQVKYKEWYQCDDAYVSQVGRATSAAAYFLFYEAVER